MGGDVAVASLHVERHGERCRAEWELQLVRRALQRRPGARAELVEAFIAPIASIARLYRGTQAISREELIQDGVVGLLRAVDRYDPTLGTPFWAYASWWVRQAMQQLVSELSRPVVLSDRAMRQLARVRNAERERLQSCGRAPTLGEIEADTGLTRSQIELVTAAARAPRALDEPIGRDESGSTFGDLLCDPRAEDAYERVPTRAEIGNLGPLLERLDRPGRVRDGGRLGLDGQQQTLRQLARSLGVSAERVRQLQQRALDKMREATLEQGEAARRGPRLRRRTVLRLRLAAGSAPSRSAVPP